MIIKILLHFLFLFFISLVLNGCTLIKLTQDSIEKAKTTSTSGYQNGIKPDEIRNVKDYIVNENDFVIIAENAYKTLYKTRNESTLGKLSILDDLIDYCEGKKGHIELGKQFTASMAVEYDGTDFEFTTIRKYHKEHKKRAYRGWMKCLDTNDDFEVLRKSRSKYFTIKHKNSQLQGYAMQWYIDYFNLDDVQLKEFNVGLWFYSSLVQFSGICIYNEGEPKISNRYTHNEEMSINEYFLQQASPTSKKKAFFMAKGTFSCHHSKNADFILDIAYSKKYQKLLYTKRQ